MFLLELIRRPRLLSAPKSPGVPLEAGGFGAHEGGAGKAGEEGGVVGGGEGWEFFGPARSCVTGGVAASGVLWCGGPCSGGFG